MHAASRNQWSVAEPGVPGLDLRVRCRGKVFSKRKASGRRKISAASPSPVVHGTAWQWQGLDRQKVEGNIKESEMLQLVSLFVPKLVQSRCDIRDAIEIFNGSADDRRQNGRFNGDPYDSAAGWPAPQATP